MILFLCEIRLARRCPHSLGIRHRFRSKWPRGSMFLRILIFMTAVAISSPAFGATEEAILLHGLCSTTHSMAKMERALTNTGYMVRNVAYPSRTAPVQQLADDAIGKAVADCQRDGAGKIHFVTHS